MVDSEVVNLSNQKMHLFTMKALFITAVKPETDKGKISLLHISQRTQVE